MGQSLLFSHPKSESLPLQEMRINLEQFGYQLHNHHVEIELFQEKFDHIEQSLHHIETQLRDDKKIHNRMIKIENSYETLAHDLKNLKAHLNETASSLASCQTKLTQIDKQLSSDVQGLRQSLHEMLTLLQKGEEFAENPSVYIVKVGDSLGQIALKYKTDIKILKQLNHLSSDKIYVGQKIILPQ
ncbi:MAG: LysM peptidoglycan-binding domain-containing protein [Chlamydiales bacterium]